MKRALDLVLGGIALVIALPLLAVLAVWVRLDSGGPVLFTQVRVGRGGRPFALLKFRTMRDAPGAPQVTAANDVRITRAGRWLRHSKLDELPQLWNVLRGDMSLVGPRPEVPRFVAHYGPEDVQAILSVRPGITDPASIAYRHESEILAAVEDPEQYYVDHILPAKLRLYREYVARNSWLGDIGILRRTAISVIAPRSQ